MVWELSKLCLGPEIFTDTQLDHHNITLSKTLYIAFKTSNKKNKQNKKQNKTKQKTKKQKQKTTTTNNNNICFCMLLTIMVSRGWFRGGAPCLRLSFYCRNRGALPYFCRDRVPDCVWAPGRHCFSSWKVFAPPYWKILDRSLNQMTHVWSMEAACSNKCFPWFQFSQ